MSLENCLQDLSGYIHWIANGDPEIAKSETIEKFCRGVDQKCLRMMLDQRNNVASCLLDRSPKQKLYLQYQEMAEANTKKYNGSKKNGKIGGEILAEESKLMIDAAMFPSTSECPKDPVLYAVVLAYEGVAMNYFKCSLGHGDFLINKMDDRLMELLENDPEIGPNLEHHAKIFLSIGLWMRNYPGFRRMVWNSRASAHKEVLRVGDKNSEMVIEKLQRASRRKQGLCIYCGGTFKGLIKKVCSSCGKPKNY